VATQARPVEGDFVTQIVEWWRQNRRTLTALAATVVIVGGGAWFMVSAKNRKEAFAARELRNEEAAQAAGNIPLATSDLTRLVAAYRGTAAAEEGAILLGQLRLTQGQADSAIRELKNFVGSKPSPRFRAAGYSLLGAASEQVGKMDEAGAAYERASEAWPYLYLKAQALLEAARAFRAANDTARAASAYERVIREFSKTPSAPEARLRLGELRRGKVPTS
jgi:tetratricopeptide (TPR) repeat protein